MRIGHQYSLRMLNEPYFFSIYGKLSYQPKRMKDFLVLFSISKRALPQLIQISAIRRHGIKVGPGETGALFYENYISRVSYPFSKTVDLTRIYVTSVTYIASHWLCYFEHHVFAH